MEELAQGRVYTGRQAEETGPDRRGRHLERRRAAAKKLAGLKPDAEVEIEILPEPKSFFEQLLDQDSAMTRVRAALPELASTLASAELIRRVFREPSLLLMPYRLEVK